MIASSLDHIKLQHREKKGFWNFVSSHFMCFVKEHFQNMEDDGILNRQSKSDLFSLATTFKVLLDKRLQECCTDWNHHTVRAQGVRSGGLPSYRPIHRFMNAVLGEDGWTSNRMREIRVLTLEEPIDYTQSTPTKHKSKYDLQTQHAHLIASPLDPWEQEACNAMHRLLAKDLLQNTEGCISSYKLHKQVMSELVAARPWYGTTDAEWAQWIAAAPAEDAPICSQIHQLSQDNMA